MLMPGPEAAIYPWRTSETGAASRPIAGKRGSHRYSACLKAGDIPVGRLAGDEAGTDHRALDRCLLCVLISHSGQIALDTKWPFRPAE
ncbi:hypothetical protein EGJ09_10610 [Pseudomonas sp. p106]|nr:hypothetical protein EGJ09_10610 [Pseudomonas sp. p106]